MGALQEASPVVVLRCCQIVCLVVVVVSGLDALVKVLVQHDVAAFGTSLISPDATQILLLPGKHQASV